MTLRQQLEQQFSKEFEKASPSIVNEKGIELKLDTQEQIYIGYDRAPRKFAVRLAKKHSFFKFLLNEFFWGKREWIAALQTRTAPPIFFQTCDNCRSPNVVGIWLHGQQFRCRKCKNKFTVHIRSTLEPINDILRRLDLG